MRGRRSHAKRSGAGRFPTPARLLIVAISSVLVPIGSPAGAESIQTWHVDCFPAANSGSAPSNPIQTLENQAGMMYRMWDGITGSYTYWTLIPRAGADLFDGTTLYGGHLQFAGNHTRLERRSPDMMVSNGVRGPGQICNWRRTR